MIIGMIETKEIVYKKADVDFCGENFEKIHENSYIENHDLVNKVNIMIRSLCALKMRMEGDPND